MTTTRRALIAASLAAPLLAACDRFAAADPVRSPIAPLKSVAPFPVGTCVQSDQVDQPAWSMLAESHVTQLTPEWEMKMEYILGPDGYRFTGPDRIALYAGRRNMALHGHTLIWYSQGAEHFERLDDAAFARAFDDYIATVAGRYRGRVRSWDVVNEPILDDGSAMRDCHWSRRFGQDGYILRAFEKAREADPEAVLFLNEYNLEGVPAKAATFLRLVERLLKAGCPIQGIGTQSHLWTEIPDGAISASIRDLAGFGLPIHVSELDCTLRTENRLDFRPRAERIARQTALVTELAESFMALPDAQRFAFTTWGLRDTDSWYRKGDKDDGKDSPLPFDGLGRPNPMAQALARAFAA